MLKITRPELSLQLKRSDIFKTGCLKPQVLALPFFNQAVLLCEVQFFLSVVDVITLFYSLKKETESR